MNHSTPVDPPHREPLQPVAPNTAGTGHCANCGATLQGPHCHLCGQPIKGMIRPLSGLTADVVDSVFNLDSRILRTIGPLYFRPGFLTTEYFIGRRVRYVTPFRLFFFLTVIAFLITQIYSEQMGLSASIGNGAKQGAEALATIQAAETPEAVTAQRDLALAGLDAATKNVGLPEEARREIEAARKEIRAQAQERMEFLEKVREAKAKGLPPPVPPEAGSDPGPAVPATGAAPSPPAAADDEPEIVLFNEPWDPKTKPLTISWLPDAGNAKLNQIISTAVKNAKNIRNEPKRFVAAFFGVVPQTLFVLMPLFAVMLKFFYLFKRRYYMEHLIVAIHSHAFLSLSMLVISLLGLARLAFPAAATPLGWLATAATFWIPLYLLLMQRRVYRQNWFMTLFKYSLIGTCYSVLIALAIAVALIISLIVA